MERKYKCAECDNVQYDGSYCTVCSGTMMREIGGDVPPQGTVVWFDNLRLISSGELRETDGGLIVWHPDAPGEYWGTLGRWETEKK